MHANTHSTDQSKTNTEPFPTYPLPQSVKMSAPHAGRQSPEPEKQSHEQVGVPESGKIDAGKTETGSKDESNETKDNTLSSNPVGPLEGAAHEKISKEGRGENI